MPMQENVNITVSSKMIPGKAHKQRMSLEPRLQITDKVVVNSKSEKEAHLMESFQVMNYFLANALYAIFPLMIEAVKYMKVERGEFAYSEEPDKELRRGEMQTCESS